MGQPLQVLPDQAETYLLTCMRYNEPRLCGEGGRIRRTGPLSSQRPPRTQVSPLLSPHPVYLALGAADNARRVAYRSLVRPQLDPETISALRLALIP